tara:strand:- start:40 stop:564 length:525 start_codon:yes stop_codon:yes gene_type:complete
MALTKVIGDGVGTLASATITAATISNQLTDANMSAGSVIQVVEDTHSAQVVTTSGVFVDTSLAVSITPRATSSKVLLLLNANMYHGTGGAQAYVTLFRGNASSGTNLGNGTKGFGAAHNAAYADKNTVSISYLDSPSTTNSQTYTCAILLDGSGYSYLNVNGEKSTLTAIEIAG